MDDYILEVDSRRRVSLGRIGHPEHTRYLAHEEPDGAIILEPVAVMPEIEARFLRNRALVDRIEDNRSRPDRAAVSFAELETEA
jgi:hypothetical protein